MSCYRLSDEKYPPSLHFIGGCGGGGRQSLLEKDYLFIDLRQEVYVFAGVYLFVCLFVCCLSVCNITQKVMDKF